MNKRHLIWGGALAVVAVLLAVLVNQIFFMQQRKLVRGHYAFEQTRENIQKLQNIKITTPKYGEINIYRDGDVWRFQEASNYFVNTDMLAVFYNMINNSIVMTVQDGTDEIYQKSGLSDNKNSVQPLELKTYNDEGKLLDEIQIGGYSENEEYRFAKKADAPFVYTISEATGFSGEPLLWMPFPLLKIDDMYVLGLILDGKYIDREFLDELLPHSSLIKGIMNSISYLMYDGIIFKKDFFAERPKSEPHTIKVETIIGLVYVLDIYYEDNTYFLAVTLDKTRIAPQKVETFVNDYTKYFADWLFVMDPEQGEILYNIRLR